MGFNSGFKGLNIKLVVTEFVVHRLYYKVWHRFNRLTAKITTAANRWTWLKST